MNESTKDDGEKMGLEMRLERMKTVCVFNIIWQRVPEARTSRYESLRRTNGRVYRRLDK